MTKDKLALLITQRQALLERQKQPFLDRLVDKANYVVPHRDDIRDNLAKGHEIGKQTYDGTAVSAAILATDGIHGYHMSPSFPWFAYRFNRKEVNKVKAAKEYLQEIESNMYDELNASNFYDASWQWVYDGVGLGLAPITSEEDVADGRIIFEAIHPGEVYVQEDAFGIVNLVHRKCKKTARWLVERFGKDNLPDQIKAAYEGTGAFNEYEIIHAIFPNDEFDDRVMLAEKKRYLSVWLILLNKHIAKISGFDTFPVEVWRYMRNGKDPFGMCPSDIVMHSIKGANTVQKSLLGAAQLAVDPPYAAPSYLEGKTKLVPRGLNYYRDPNDKIYPINSGGAFPIGRDVQSDIRNAIREGFHVDAYLMLTQLAGEGGQKTAYEVAELLGEKAAILGAELGPLNMSMSRILERVFEIGTMAGRMPPIPDILYDLAEQYPGLRFDPIYLGPLAQAQREKFHKSGIMKFMGDISGLIQAVPDALDNIDTDQIVSELADIDNVPQTIIRDPKVRDSIRAAKIQAQQQAQQMQGIGEMAQMMKTGAEADKTMKEAG